MKALFPERSWLLLWFCLVLVAYCGVSSAGATASADEEAGASGPGDGEVRTYEAVPRSIHQRLRVRFNEQGEPVRHRHEMNATFVTTPEEEAKIIAYRAKNVEVTTSTGHQPKLRSVRPDSWHLARNDRHALKSRPMSISLQMDPPPYTTTALKRVTGELVYLVVGGPTETFELGPFTEIQGKEQKVPGVKDARLTIRRQKDRTRVLIQGEGWFRLQKMEYLDAEGKTIHQEHERAGFYAGRGGYRPVHNFEMPEQGRIVLHMWSELSRKKVRFEAKNVPLPDAFSESTAELARAVGSGIFAAARTTVE